MNATAMNGWQVWVLAASALALSACGGAEGPIEGDAPSSPTDDAGAEASQVVTPPDGGGVGTGLATDSGGDGSSALHVEINVQGEGTTADTAFVAFRLTVGDTTAGTPVVNATVTGGPVGASVPMIADPSDPGAYDAQRTGYSPAWEFAIARGGRRVWNAVVTGASFPTATYGIDWYNNPPALRVNWSPADEPGIASAVTVMQTYPTPPPYQTPTHREIDGHDEGTAGPFFLPPNTSSRYSVNVSLTTNWVYFDWGAATIGITGQAK
jgi:hypothetical protein